MTGGNRQPPAYGIQFHGQIHPHKNLELSGLISYGGTTRSIFYQMWFTEHHPDMCGIGPTERWLEQAIFLLSHDFVFREALYAATSSYVMRGYATHAVRDYLLDGLNLMVGWDTTGVGLPHLGRHSWDIQDPRRRGMAQGKPGVCDSEGHPPTGVPHPLSRHAKAEAQKLQTRPQTAPGSRRRRTQAHLRRPGDPGRGHRTVAAPQVYSRLQGRLRVSEAGRHPGVQLLRREFSLLQPEAQSCGP